MSDIQSGTAWKLAQWVDENSWVVSMCSEMHNKEGRVWKLVSSVHTVDTDRSLESQTPHPPEAGEIGKWVLPFHRILRNAKSIH